MHVHMVFVAACTSWFDVLCTQDTALQQGWLCTAKPVKRCIAHAMQCLRRHIVPHSTALRHTTSPHALLTSQPLYAALLRLRRFSIVDPWMHEKNDGFPLLYVRSHAARLPGSVVRDWLVRCKVALAASHGRLVLKVRS
jgi:hypothetical protein